MMIGRSPAARSFGFPADEEVKHAVWVRGPSHIAHTRGGEYEICYRGFGANGG